MRILCLALMLAGCAKNVSEPEKLAKLEGQPTYVALPPTVVGIDPSCALDFETGDDVSGFTNGFLSKKYITKTSVSGLVSYGPARTEGKGDTYKIVEDTILYRPTMLKVWLRQKVEKGSWRSPCPKDKNCWRKKRLLPTGEFDTLNLFASLRGDEHYFGTQRFEYRLTAPDGADASGNESIEAKWEPVTVAVYVGVGVRMSAEYVSTAVKVSVDDIASLSVNLDAKVATGNLSFEVLGLSGDGITASSPGNADLSPQAVLEASKAVGNVKGQIHDDDTLLTPTVVGMDLPLRPDQRVVATLKAAILEAAYTGKLKITCDTGGDCQDCTQNTTGTGEDKDVNE